MIYGDFPHEKHEQRNKAQKHAEIRERRKEVYQKEV